MFSAYDAYLERQVELSVQTRAAIATDYSVQFASRSSAESAKATHRDKFVWYSYSQDEEYESTDTHVSFRSQVAVVGQKASKCNRSVLKMLKLASGRDAKEDDMKADEAALEEDVEWTMVQEVSATTRPQSAFMGSDEAR